jgi:virulence-associated protein VapD
VSTFQKLLLTILSGQSDGNISFNDLTRFLQRLGFSTRTKGSHHIFWRDEVAEILNLQSVGSKAKPYQVKQVRELIVKYQLSQMEADDE